MAASSQHSTPLFQKLFTGFHRSLLRLSGGRIGSRFGKMPILLLTSKGRKSGAARTLPLTYLPDGGGYVLIASNGGKDWPPAWFGNLRANPGAVVQIRGKTIPVRAAVADAEQRSRLWPIVVERYPNYAGYAKKTSREIPLVILTPRR